MSNYFQQAICITGNCSVDLDRLEAMGDAFRKVIMAEGGDPKTVTVQRLQNLDLNEVKIDVYYGYRIYSPDHGFEVEDHVEFTVHGDNQIMAAIYRRGAALGASLHEVQSKILQMAHRVIAGHHQIKPPASGIHMDYLTDTLYAVLEVFPKMTTGKPAAQKRPEAAAA